MSVELWLGPDVNADVVPLVEDIDQWATARTRCARFQMFQSQIALAEHENDYGVGLNYFPRLRDTGFFQALRFRNLPLTVEIAGVKNWNPNPPGPPAWTEASVAGSVKGACDQLIETIERVRDCGGEVASVTFDDPLTAALYDHQPALPLDVAYEAMRTVAREGWIRGVHVGWTEAYPLCTPEQIISCAERISPAFLHMDIDEQHAKQIHSDTKISTDLQKLRAQCRAWGIPFGIILNGQRGDDPQAYRAGFWEWFNFVRRMLDGDPDRYILESWKKKNLPVNLPDSSQFSHTGLLREVAALIPF